MEYNEEKIIQDDKELKSQNDDNILDEIKEDENIKGQNEENENVIEDNIKIDEKNIKKEEEINKEKKEEINNEKKIESKEENNDKKYGEIKIEEVINNRNEQKENEKENNLNKNEGKEENILNEIEENSENLNEKGEEKNEENKNIILNKKKTNEYLEGNYTIKRNLSELDEYDKSIKVIILGDSNVGKSSLIHRLINKEFVDLPATLGIEYHTYVISINEFKIRMQIWDTAGQEKFNSIVSNYYKNTEVAIFVYSIDKENTFDNIKKWYNKFYENCTGNSINILLGNKSDLKDENRKVSYEQGKNFAKNNNLKIFKEISCKSNDDNEVNNIIETFDEIAKYIYDIYKDTINTSSSIDINYVASNSMVALGEKQRKNKSGKKCCL